MFVSISHQSPEGFNYFEEAFRYIQDDLAALLRTVEATEMYPTYQGRQQLQAVCYKIRAEYGVFRHYYRDYAIPAAEAMAQRLQQDYESVKQGYPAFVQQSGYFDNVLKDVIHAGYVGINNKLESFVEFVKAHAKGKAYGSLGANPEKAIRYDVLLQKQYDILLDDFLAKDAPEPVLCDDCGKPMPRRRVPTSERPALYPRIQRVRLIANRVKHHSGYPKGENDPLLQDLFGQDTNRPIQVSVAEFLHDLAYADAYLFLLSELVISAFLALYTEEAIQRPMSGEPDQVETRKRIAVFAQNFANELKSNVAEYRSQCIDQLKLVP